MPPSPLTNLTAQLQRGRQQRGGRPGAPQTESPLTSGETGPGKQIGKESTIGFLAEKMIGGLAKKKKLAATPQQGLSQQAMDNWKI